MYSLIDADGHRIGEYETCAEALTTVATHLDRRGPDAVRRWTLTRRADVPGNPMFPIAAGDTLVHLVMPPPSLRAMIGAFITSDAVVAAIVMFTLLWMVTH